MEKKILCFVFLCYVVIPVFCNIKFTINESFSIQQIEPKEKSIEDGDVVSKDSHITSMLFGADNRT